MIRSRGGASQQNPFPPSVRNLEDAHEELGENQDVDAFILF